jgi:hypothetical protein
VVENFFNWFAFQILGRIQKVIDELNLASYSNLDSWVGSLDKQVESMLIERLEDAVNVWISLIGMVFIGVIPVIHLLLNCRRKRRQERLRS